MFSWSSFLDKYNVDWVEGPSKNVAAGKIGINCPWCIGDTGHHLGINPKTGSYSCWKDVTHRSSKPYYLISRLAKCSKTEAKKIYDENFSSAIDLEEILRELEPVETDYTFECEYTGNEFILKEDSKASEIFYDYLYDRGFDDPVEVAKLYKIRGCITGKFENRIIIPFFYNGVLQGWTGRTIKKNETIRYKTYPEGKNSVAGKLLYNYDNANQKTKAVVLTEGPFDAIKLDAYGLQYGVRSVALCGIILTRFKLKHLISLAANTDKVFIVLDQAAGSQALDIFNEASSFIDNLEIVDFDLAKDPGDLTKHQAIEFTKSLLK